MVCQWVEQERGTHWANSKTGLSARNRPLALSQWQKNRYTGKEPSLSSDFIASFSQQVWSWWISLQPEWRIITAGEKPNPLDPKEVGRDWKKLDQKGVNGWFGLLVCIKWWGAGLAFCAMEERAALEADWLRAIGDISDLLGALLVYRTSRK